jgi:hypothetical protein
MAGLSAKLTSLVEAADDPYVLNYAFTNLAVNIPDDQRGFASRIRSVRNHLFTAWFQGHSPLGRLKRLQKEMVREQVRMQLLLQDRRREQQREQQEIALLNREEQKLAVQLFQQSTLNVLVRQVVSAKPEVLDLHITDNNPLIRLLVVHTIGWRHLHREVALIERLNDPDPVVREAAHAALVRVARGTDFGPISGASPILVARSIEKWQQWLALQKGESPETLAKAIDLQTVPAEVRWLCEELVKAKPDQQLKVLESLRDGEDLYNTTAIALAIPRLPADTHRKARETVEKRLTPLETATLRDLLQDESEEMRRAAALALGRKKAVESIPDLLLLLDDSASAVIQAARTALKELTGEDFGPLVEAGPKDQAKAARAWRHWWQERQTVPK